MHILRILPVVYDQINRREKYAFSNKTISPDPNPVGFFKFQQIFQWTRNTLKFLFFFYLKFQRTFFIIQLDNPAGIIN